MDAIQEMGIKELEHVVLKAKEDVEFGNKYFQAGEPVLYLNNVQISLLSEDTRVVAAQGGFLNQPRVVWEDRNNTIFQFSNGTLNPISLGLLMGANVLKPQSAYIPYAETLELARINVTENLECSFTLKYAAELQHKPRFYYFFDAENPQYRLKVISETYNEKTGRTNVTVQLPKKPPEEFSIMADYYFIPKKLPMIYSMDRERKPKLFTLEATFYLKDENDGLLHTGILEMPKVYITSNINLRMGERADPTVGTFRIVAMPDNYDSYDSVVWQMKYLDDDIYGI